MAKEITNGITDSMGNRLWKNSQGYYHREDGPAYIAASANGLIMWCINGEFHRLNGPAVTHHNGKEEWWVNGYHCTDELTYWLAVTEWKKGHP